jgi:hypothetical protein
VHAVVPEVFASTYYAEATPGEGEAVSRNIGGLTYRRRLGKNVATAVNI